MSFDIGIKNLAYCYLEYLHDTTTDVSLSQTKILDWRVIDLMADANPIDVSGLPTVTCTCKLSTTKKNVEAKICGKKAKYGLPAQCPRQTSFAPDTVLSGSHTGTEGPLMKARQIPHSSNMMVRSATRNVSHQQLTTESTEGAHSSLGQNGSKKPLLSYRPVRLGLQTDVTDMSNIPTEQSSSFLSYRPDSFLNNEYYCETHAKVDKRWMIPKRAHEKASLNKLKREPLDLMVAEQKIVLDPSTKSTKKTLVDALLAHFLSKSYTILDHTTVGNSKHADLITLGRNMITIIDRISVLRDSPPTHIIMENQISTVASRMKTLQGELTMYFLLRHPTASVEYISSANKLKFFAPAVPNDTPVQVPRKERRDAEEVVPNANQIYKKHKQDAITYTTQILQENPILQSWEPVLTGKKKDDLADSFLQGIWYLRAKRA